MKAIVTVGISASGKTTWAESFVKTNGGVIICRDDVRTEILESRLGRKLEAGELWKLWKFKDENLVNDVVSAKLASAAGSGDDVIIADTNLSAQRNTTLKNSLEDIGYDVEFKYFDISVEDAWKRDRARFNTVGHEVIYRQYMQYCELTKKKVIADPSKRRAIIVDIDGTLAHMVDRGPFDWHRVDEDDAYHEIVDMVNGFHDRGYSVVVTSGRDAVCRQKTLDWLRQKAVQFDVLFMRDENDMRKDSIVKEEIFWNKIYPYFDVKLVIDDRPQVVRTWLSLGLKVAIVGNPYMEF